VHSVSQRPNLRHLGEPLGGAKSLLEAVSFKKTTEGMGRGRVASAIVQYSALWMYSNHPSEINSCSHRVLGIVLSCLVGGWYQPGRYSRPSAEA